MAEFVLELKNEKGLHLLACGEFVKVTSRFRARILVAKIGKEEMEVDGKSILGLIELGAPCGTRLRIRVDGEDGDSAQQALTELVENRFGEEK